MPTHKLGPAFYSVKYRPLANRSGARLYSSENLIPIVVNYSLNRCARNNLECRSGRHGRSWNCQVGTGDDRMIHKNPQSVAIVAMGSSFRTYVQFVANLGRRERAADEVWTVNAMGAVLQHDRLFVMDDIGEILEPLARQNHESMPAGLIPMLTTHPGPVYTSKPYPQFPGTVPYPLEDVINAVGNIYFNTTVAYAMGLAILLEVKEIGLYGCDFTYPDLHVAESGRACVEFLCGIAGARGAKITVAGDSTLLGADVPIADKLYGYHDPLVIGRSEDGKRITVRPETDQSTAVAPEPAAEQQPEPEQPSAVDEQSAPIRPLSIAPPPPVDERPQEQTDELRGTSHGISDNCHDRSDHRLHAGSHR